MSMPALRICRVPKHVQVCVVISAVVRAVQLYFSVSEQAKVESAQKQGIAAARACMARQHVAYTCRSAVSRGRRKL